MSPHAQALQLAAGRQEVASAQRLADVFEAAPGPADAHAAHMHVLARERLKGRLMEARARLRALER